ncbi:MAG TPA: bifunctional DNA-formamidopyrimidine glycosylase/DNA-(apurinic or apyrimidinic site) lyase [Candidatus Acidoferrum sp.]|jgi:formamidopyrimidine-DNA glycosylase
MPELPEVETVVRGLQRSLPGRKILSVILGKTDFIDDPVAMESNLPGRRIESVQRYGKFMLLRLSPVTDATNTDDEPSALLVHLGMTGRLGPEPAAQPLEKHTHVRMPLDDGKELRYKDPRRFGRMAYLSGGALAEELERFGADPLEVSLQDFFARIRSRPAQIKALLLNQSVLRGVGNIYADESLWRAKIHPARRGTSLSLKQARLLRTVLQDILRKAIIMRGSSIADFLDAEGQRGEYQRRHKVYDREGKSCARCRTPIRRVVVAGRGTHYCPKCQPAPRRKK